MDGGQVLIAVSGFNRLVEPAGYGLSDSQTQALCIGRFEHEPGVLARESEGEARRELVLDHHVPLDVGVWQPKRSALDRLEKALRLDTDSASEGDRLGEHPDEGDDLIVHHQLEAGPGPCSLTPQVFHSLLKRHQTRIGGIISIRCKA
jgi:hypothetical protein